MNIILPRPAGVCLRGRLSSNVRHRVDKLDRYSPPQAEVSDLKPIPVALRPPGRPPATPRFAGFLGIGGFVLGIVQLYLKHGEGSALFLGLALLACATAAWIIDLLVRKAMRSLPWTFALLGVMAVGGIQYWETSPPGTLRAIYVAQAVVFGLAAVLFLLPSSLRWFKSGNA